MKADPKFLYEMMTLCKGFAEQDKVRDLLDRVYQDGLLATPDQDAARWRKLSGDIDMKGRYISERAIYPKMKAMGLAPTELMSPMETSVTRAIERDLTIRWFDRGGAETLTSFLDQRIAASRETTPSTSATQSG